MPRTDQAYWAQLRRDRASSWAAGLAILAVLAALLALIGLLVSGGSAEARANPLYWALLLPFAWWASELASFEPRPVRTLVPATLVAPLVAGICLGVAVAQARGWTPWLVATVVATAAAIGARLAWRRSLLLREGPSR